MQRITIAGIMQANSVSAEFGDDGTIKSAVMTALISTGTNGNQRSAPVSVHCYGLKAENLAQIDNSIDQHVLIEGNAEYENKVELHIQSATVHLTATQVPINAVTIAGNLGGDPEAKHFESGNQLSEFSVAVTRRKNVTDWFNVTFWGKTAAVCTNYLNKGSKVAVHGRLNIEQWNDKTTGQLQTRFKVTGDTLSMLGKSDSNPPNNPPKTQEDFEEYAF